MSKTPPKTRPSEAPLVIEIDAKVLRSFATVCCSAGRAARSIACSINDFGLQLGAFAADAAVAALPVCRECGKQIIAEHDDLSRVVYEHYGYTRCECKEEHQTHV